MTRKNPDVLGVVPGRRTAARNREQSIGVSVKLTSSDTMMANAAV